MEKKYKGTILLVEDVQDRNSRFKQMFENANYFVVGHTDGGSAIDDIREGLKYNVLLVDLSLGENARYDGRDVISHSRCLNPNTPIVSISGYDSKLPEVDVHFYKCRDGSPRNLIQIVDSLVRFSD